MGNVLCLNGLTGRSCWLIFIRGGRELLHRDLMWSSWMDVTIFLPLRNVLRQHATGLNVDFTLNRFWLYSRPSLKIFIHACPLWNTLTWESKSYKIDSLKHGVINSSQSLLFYGFIYNSWNTNYGQQRAYWSTQRNWNLLQWRFRWLSHQSGSTKLRLFNNFIIFTDVFQKFCEISPRKIKLRFHCWLWASPKSPSS